MSRKLLRQIAIEQGLKSAAKILKKPIKVKSDIRLIRVVNLKNKEIKEKIQKWIG